MLQIPPPLEGLGGGVASSAPSETRKLNFHEGCNYVRSTKILLFTSLTLLFSFCLFAHPTAQQLSGISLNFLFIISREKQDNYHSFLSKSLTSTRQVSFFSIFVVVLISSFLPDRYWHMRMSSKNVNKRNPSIRWKSNSLYDSQAVFYELLTQMSLGVSWGG